jgi:hypothetical protein
MQTNIRTGKCPCSAKPAQSLQSSPRSFLPLLDSAASVHLQWDGHHFAKPGWSDSDGDDCARYKFRLKVDFAPKMEKQNAEAMKALAEPLGEMIQHPLRESPLT